MSLATYLANDGILKAYRAAAGRFSCKTSPDVEKSLQESIWRHGETFFVEAVGNAPHNFNSRLGDQDMDILAQALNLPATFMDSLSLPYNEISDVGAQHIGEMLCAQGAPCQLTKLNLRGNSIGPDGCKLICVALTWCKNLKYLDMSKNPICRQGGLAVVELMAYSGSMEELYLADTEIDIDVIVAVSATLLTGEVKLKVCDVENPRIQTLQEEHTVHLGRMLRVNTHLSKICLGKHRLRDDGIRQLVSFLLENKTLRILDLRCNEIGAEGAKQIGTLLSSDCQLMQLNLSNNRIGEKDNCQGATAIAEALLKNRMLVHIDLNNNLLYGAALHILGDAIDQNGTLESIALFHNKWDQLSSYKFHQILNDRARIIPLRSDFVTNEVDLRIDVCLVWDFKA